MVNKNIFSLKGKKSLITGGGGLLGPEHAIALANQGSEVFLIDIDKQGLDKGSERVKKANKSAKVETFHIDLKDESELKSLKNFLINKNVHIDILVNNAAINPKMDASNNSSGKVEDYKLDNLREEIEVGLIGTFLCSKIFGSAMAKKKSGVIINIASDLAILAPDQRVYSKNNNINTVKNFKPIGYPMVKSGMLGLNRYLATYWAHRGIRVNCLVPGSVKNKQTKKLIKEIESRIPLSRLAKKEDYHGSIVFLASDASAYMTGQILVVDGGRSIW